MKAIRVRDGRFVLEADAPEPVSGPGEALVEIEAVGLERLDLQIARSEFPVRPAEPYVSGGNGAGRVIRAEGFEPGARVWIGGEGLGVVRDGVAAERVAVPVEALKPLRDDVDALVGATFFVPCMSASAALHEIGGLRAGERVAVRGANGAVGRMAVQMARRGGAAEVIALLRHDAPVPEGARAVVAPGPDELRALHGSDIDLLLDTVAGPGLAASIGMMRPRGRIVLVGYVGGTALELDALELLVRDVSLLALNGMSRAPETIGRAGEWLDALVSGALTLPIVTFSPEQVEDAVRAVDGAPSVGRVAIRF